MAKIDAHSATIDRRRKPGARKFFFEQHARRTGDRLRDPRPVDQFARGNATVRCASGCAARTTSRKVSRASGSKLKSLCCRGVGQPAEREIHFAAVQQLHHLVAGFAENAHVEQRPFGFQFGDGHGQQVGRGAHDRADGQLAVTAAALDVEVGGKARQVGQRAARIGEGGDAERRGLHAARVALEQQEAERFFDVAQHAARARLGDIDGVGGLMQVAGVVERDEQREMLEFEPVDEGDGGSVLVHGACSDVTRLRCGCDSVSGSPNPNNGLKCYRSSEL